MSAISEKLYERADRLLDDNPFALRDAVNAVLTRAATWRAAGMPMSAFGDELLLILAGPLGVRLAIGQFAQLVDLDEEGK